MFKMYDVLSLTSVHHILGVYMQHCQTHKTTPLSLWPCHMLLSRGGTCFPDSHQLLTGFDTPAVALFDILTLVLINTPPTTTHTRIIFYLDRQFDALHCIWVGQACSVYLMFWVGHRMH